ncbi:MAG: acetyl-CoA carboxylase biotin carboxyl carrier protein [Candidatus Omnitrophota bacterium]
MELKKLKEFIKFMEDNNLCELEIEEDGKKIRLKKNISSGPAIIAQPQAVFEKQEKEEKKESGIEVKAPMVGTFYGAPSPGSKPFVGIGDVIKPGDVICIIEAMKLMNEIKTEIGGKVSQILVENGQSIEFGQPLIKVELV